MIHAVPFDFPAKSTLDDLPPVPSGIAFIAVGLVCAGVAWGIGGMLR
jgi:hypothetical protein